MWQPWAGAVALGLKTYETRSWRPPAALLGQRIAIHAAKRCEDLEAIAAIQGYLSEFGDPDDLIYLLKAPRPGGAVVATARLTGCYRTEDIADDLPALEYALGGYGPGRFAWKLGDIRPLDPPVPAKGHQGFWDWEGGDT